ncbi:hypothetical protein, partial [Sutterella wadsworthensis]|uniref:hypothetical protein n=1 Tax=Sutterella wadsworthensis TaxID=40545 RepID=UPI003967C006
PAECFNVKHPLNAYAAGILRLNKNPQGLVLISFGTFSAASSLPYWHLTKVNLPNGTLRENRLAFEERARPRKISSIGKCRKKFAIFICRLQDKEREADE